ncbi:PDDEXK nuclease domain-containing protein [Bacteroides ihuae]|uniref:PDDEXK nuclease domain-containing protein n=1 Tax=Bacteroides ihuae TaxID=1852362 RepID=UPI0008D964AD|nr:PDDEXK nuclease domain-containing protein [Bacteroides ihuae]
MDKLKTIQDIHPDEKGRQVEDSLYQSIKDIIQTARATTYQAVDFAMTQAKNEAIELLGQPAAEEFIRKPYILNFMGIKEASSYFEKDIEQGLIDNMQSFLLELGKGFSFVARQRRMQFDDSDFYIDLVFYNYILKCFVLIDLKLGELTHQDVGQMDSYVRMYEEKFRAEDDNPTIGLILCSKRNEAIVKYSILNDNKNIFASKYLLYLPTEEELKRQIEKERNMIESLNEEG